MEKNQIDKIEKLIRNNNIQQAEIELAKFGPEFFKKLRKASPFCDESEDWLKINGAKYNL